MALSEETARQCMKRLLVARMRLLGNHGFFGLLLMHMRYAIDEETPTAYTDGKRIVFGVEFLQRLSESELDFVLMHEVMHVVLQHCIRGRQYEAERYNIACDIVVNSNILLENNMDMSSITLREYGISMHQAPDGKEGYTYTAEEVYAMVPPPKGKPRLLPGSLSEHSGGSEEDEDDTGKDDKETDGAYWQQGRAARHHAKRKNGTGGWDDHGHWNETEEDDTLRDVWVERVEEAAEAIRVRDPSNSRGLLPMFAERLLEDLHRAQTDWRTVLSEFVQEEIHDYSFSPPDRRFDDSPFYLPDYNEKRDVVLDILFMVDTSGSMSDELVAAAYSEIKGAIDQFGGALQGWLGFFDAAIIEPVRFEDEETFRHIRAAGGGGTDFQIIFEYVAAHMQDALPACIVILTDGYAPFPKEHLAMGIPVLWLLNNEVVQPPWGRVARITV